MTEMRKYMIITAAALLALASCTKVEENRPADKVISFQVSRYQNTKAEGDPADYKDAYADVPFGAYAWFKGNTAAENAVFMTNQKVSYNQAEKNWLPDGSTYYWPKSGSIDFICYSPYSADAKGITIAEDKISFKDYTPAADDLMYGDKAVGLKDNADTYYYNGVPVLFHHALARVAFQVKAAYLQKTVASGDVTKWEITVNSVTIKDVRTTGSLELALDGKAWKLPEPKVWTASDAKKDLTLETKDLKVLTDQPQALGEGMFVLPQALSLGQQVVLNITIKTYRDMGKGFELAFTETGIEVAAKMDAGNLPQWGINQDITYTLVIAPLGSNGSDPKDPGKPVDPSNPVLTDAVISFDPAVSDWEIVDAQTLIQL